MIVKNIFWLVWSATTGTDSDCSENKKEKLEKLNGERLGLESTLDAKYLKKELYTLKVGCLTAAKVHLKLK